MQFSHFSLPADQNALPFVDRLKIIPSYELSIGANKKRLKYVQADVDHFLIVHQKLRKRFRELFFDDVFMLIHLGKVRDEYEILVFGS